MNQATPSVCDALLLRLDAALDSERDALRLMDSRAVERLSEEKQALDIALRDAWHRSDVPPDKDLLLRVRQKVRDNQVLLVHARNCVRSALEAATGSPQDGYDSNRPPPPKAVRFDMKG